MDASAPIRAGSNDPLLDAFVLAASPATRAAALETVIVTHAKPVIAGVLARYRHTDGSLTAAEAEDVASSVVVRLVERLQAASDGSAAAIERLEDFVAATTYNAIYDLLRRRHPEWTRLRNRIRHVVTRDPRFVTRATTAGMLCELTGRSWRLVSVNDRARPADAVEALLRRAKGAVPFDELVRALAEAWNVIDRPARRDDERIVESDATRIESRQYLEALWREIRELRAPQRAALLFNLRDADGGNAIPFLIILGIATLPEIAAAVEVPIERLAELWNDLPLDDLKIAAMLGVTRQQVINLRKSARERLARRMRQA